MRPIVRITLLLAFLGGYATTGECAEYDFRGSSGYFMPVSRQCCSGFGLTPTDKKDEPCIGEPGDCLEESLFVAGPDSTGLRRDTWYFLSYQVAAIAILYAMPESTTGWTDEQKDEYSLSVWWDNVTNPQMDSDDFYINYVLHPYWGSAYFVRARERGYDNVGSFWYSVLLSSMYEFGAEALFEEPSTQDLIVTPVLGSLLGMYFMDVREGVREREAALGRRSTWDKWLMVLTDPLGSLNRQFDKLFGWDAELQVRPYSYVQRHESNLNVGPMRWDQDRVYGLEFRMQW